MNVNQLELFEDLEEIPEGDTQVCKICQKEKHVSLFYKHRAFKTGIDNRCKACAKKEQAVLYDLKKRFGHLKTEVCDCCGETSNKTLVIDHCHDTLRFRGWLCEQCNHGIGKLGDNLDGVLNAIRYLERFENG